MREPLYLRVQRDIAAQIADGRFNPGDFLPSEQQLQQHYRVSRTTVRKAVADLVAAGLLVIDRGNGTRVAQPRPERPEAGLFSFSSTMRRLGRLPGSEQCHACISVAAPEGAWPDDAGAAQSYLHLSRVRTADGIPVSMSDSWIPAGLLPGIDATTVAEQDSLYALLADLDLGIVEVVDSYGLICATDEIAAALQVTPGSALLLVERVGYGPDRQPIESSRIIICADRYRPTTITRSNQ